MAPPFTKLVSLLAVVAHPLLGLPAAEAVRQQFGTLPGSTENQALELGDRIAVLDRRRQGLGGEIRGLRRELR